MTPRRTGTDGFFVSVLTADGVAVSEVDRVGQMWGRVLRGVAGAAISGRRVATPSCP